MTFDQHTTVTERRRLKEEFGSLFESVSSALFDADPAKLNFGFNRDEYEPEVDTILPRLSQCHSVEDVERVVYEECCHWFGAEAGPREQYLPIAEKVWRLWCEFSQSPG